MILTDANVIALDFLAQLAPFCERAEIAGSIRRRKPEVGDIEIVCIPRGRDLVAFVETVRRWPKIRGEPTGRYTQRRHPSGMKLDLFMADKRTWGSILLIRTGDWEFSRWFVGTALPRKGYKQEGGCVRRNGVVVPTPEENDMFILAGIPFIEPTERYGRKQ